MSAPARVRAKIVRAPGRNAASTQTAPPAKAMVADEDEGDDNAVSLYGDLHGGLTQIRASNVRLVLTFGEFTNGRDVLVPLVDWQTYGHQMSAGFEPEAADRGSVLSSRLLSFDNLAFLLQDLSYDTRDAVRLLVTQSKTGVAPVEDRTRYAARMLRLASKHLSGAAEQMEELLAEGDDEPTERRPVRDDRSKRPARRIKQG